MIWKDEVKHLIIGFLIIFIIEVLLKNDQNYAYLSFSILWKVILISVVRIVFLIKQKKL